MRRGRERDICNGKKRRKREVEGCDMTCGETLGIKMRRGGKGGAESERNCVALRSGQPAALSSREGRSVATCKGRGTARRRPYCISECVISLQGEPFLAKRKGAGKLGCYLGFIHDGSGRRSE
jgi:hypothetical protein